RPEHDEADDQERDHLAPAQAVEDGEHDAESTEPTLDRPSAPSPAAARGAADRLRPGGAVRTCSVALGYPSLLDPPIGFAHRGARAHAPENTLDAFALALRLGATGLETDLWLTADGIPVLDHD